MPRPPHAFPADARMFFCIGAQKAGTTWLYDFLRQSPECHFSRNKELHYFDVLAGYADLALDLRVRLAATLAGQLTAQTGPANIRTLTQLREITELLTIYTGAPGDHGPYLQYLLKGRRRQPVVCDITPSYAILNRATFADMAAIGEAKFLFILRDPIARMWSQIRMAVASGNLPDADYEQACLDRALTLINSRRLKKLERADYKRTIIELEAAVPADRISYVFYEDLFSPETAQQTATDICTFAGITPIAADTDRRSNTGKSLGLPPQIKAAFARAFAPQYSFVRSRFGEAVPAAWTDA